MKTLFVFGIVLSAVCAQFPLRYRGRSSPPYHYRGNSLANWHHQQYKYNPTYRSRPFGSGLSPLANHYLHNTLRYNYDSRWTQGPPQLHYPTEPSFPVSRPLPSVQTPIVPIVSNQEPLVFKHVYVHVAPPDDEPPPPPQPIVLPQPKKTYKIVFIKVPAVPPPPVPVPVLARNEEKTLVYVLIKKPEDPQQVYFPGPAVEHSKPEVYFIKYKPNDPDNVQTGLLDNPGLYNRGNTLSNSYPLNSGYQIGSGPDAGTPVEEPADELPGHPENENHGLYSYALGHGAPQDLLLSRLSRSSKEEETIQKEADSE